SVAPRFNAGQRKQLPDHFIQTLTFALDPVERSFRRPASRPARQAERHSLTRQRRSQLMRNVAEQTPLRFDQRLDAAGHQIEITPQVSNLIMPLEELIVHAGGEVSLR